MNEEKNMDESLTRMVIGEDGQVLNNTGNWVYPVYSEPYTDWHYSWYVPPTKITLPLSDVLLLRDRAKKDKELREVLRKIAPHLETTVDFP